MKRLVLFICTLFCANVLLAQTEFIVGNLKYKVNYSNPQEVGVYAADTTIITANIPETVTYQGTTYNVTYIGTNAFEDCSSLTSVTIPNSVTSIGWEAFEDCNSLTSITIPNSVTYIGHGAFEDCSSLTSINIPNSVTSIEQQTFKNCNSLTSVTIPNSVTSIGWEAFENCSSLTSITIPNSVTSIEESAFSQCSSLISVTIGNSVTYIGIGAFYECSSLTSVTIPNSVTSIGHGAFSWCSSLSSVTIPNSVTSIGEGTFAGCSSLTSLTLNMSDVPADLFYTDLISGTVLSPLQNLTLGENVTSIGSGAFSSSSFLQNVTCLATTPPTLADNTVFPYPNIATLTVPCGTLEAYSSATSFWNMFFMGRISEDCEDDNGIEQAEAESISFFPNPTKSEITFSQAIEKVEVIDLTGKTILTFSNAKTINIESLPAGAYYLRLTNEEKTSLQKVIKQ